MHEGTTNGNDRDSFQAIARLGPQTLHIQTGQRPDSFQPSPKGLGSGDIYNEKGQRPGLSAFALRWHDAAISFAGSAAPCVEHKGSPTLIPAAIRPHLYAYLATVTRDNGSECPRVGGTEDHVHLAILISRTQTIAALVNHLKSHSSRWMKEQTGAQNFAWQHGYGVFSVGLTDRPALERYIDNQEKHHQKLTFQDEYRAFLLRYGVPFDEKYVWD